MRTSPWNVGGKVCLLGDSAHAMVPFFGQGCNCGFEDVVVLVECFENNPSTFSEFEAAFLRYYSMRKENTDAIQDMALANFVEMREHVGNVEFLLHKRIEHKIEEALPLQYRSSYAMTCYGSHGGITYSMAKKCGVVQSLLMKELAEGLTCEDELDMARAQKLISEKLEPVYRELGVDVSTLTNHKQSLVQ